MLVGGVVLAAKVAEGVTGIGVGEDVGVEVGVFKVGLLTRGREFRLAEPQAAKISRAVMISNRKPKRLPKCIILSRWFFIALF